MHDRAALVLQGLGGDPYSFVARQLTTKIASSADLILTMTRGHRDTVLEHAPNKLHKTFTLIEASLLAADFGAETVRGLAELRPRLGTDVDYDISDPIGRGDDVFEAVGSQIAEGLGPILDLLRRSAESPG